jgi:hypothetical protein
MNTSSVQKQKQKKNIIKCLAHTKWGADQENLLIIHKMVILSTLRYGEEAYGSASKSVLIKLEPTHNRGIRLALGVFAVRRTENALREAGVSTLADMRNLIIKITAIRFINPNHPIRPYCLNPIKLDEYALRPAVPKPLFVRAFEFFGKLQIDTRKIERSPQYCRPPWTWTNIDHNRFDYELCAIRRGASNERFQAETFRILNEKYEHLNNIQRSKKDENVGYAVVLSESTIKIRRFSQNSIYSYVLLRYLLHCELQPKTSNHHRLTQHNNSSPRQKKIQEHKNSIDPKTDRSSIHKYPITMGSESRSDTWKRSNRRHSKRSTERRNSPHRKISPTGVDSIDKRKTRTRTTRKMGKLDHHNHERAQTTPHNEDKHQNGCHKPLTHWIYQSHPFCSDGQRTQTLLRSKFHRRPHSMAL